MSRAKSASVKLLDDAAIEPSNGPADLRIVEARAAAAFSFPALATARITQLEGSAITVLVGGLEVSAEVDSSVHPVVLRGAFERGERVLCEHHEGDKWLIVGSLRAQPTPGIDVASDYVIEADHVVLRGRHDVTLSTEAAGLVLRAIGEVETYAERILSRAEGVHKIVGRMLKLN